MKKMLEMISAAQLDQYRGNRGIIIDLREESLFRKAHIAGALNMPYETIDYKRFKRFQNKKIILYCERGGTSMIVGKELANRGFQVASVIGGISAYRGNRLQKD